MYDGWSNVDELFQAITGAPPTTSSNSPYATTGICNSIILS